MTLMFEKAGDEAVAARARRSAGGRRAVDGAALDRTRRRDDSASGTKPLRRSGDLS
jgi:hypothetical protein